MHDAPAIARDRNRLQHSRRALAHSVSPAAWRRTLEFRRADPTVAIAVRVGLAGAIVLVVGGLLGRTEIAGFAALGSLAAAFLRYEPYPRLARKLAGVAALIVAYTALGATLGVAAAPIWSQVVLVSAGAGIAYWLVLVFGITGPGPVVMIFAAAGAAGFADTWADAASVTVASALGGLAGWLVAMAPALSHPHSPSRVAVARALAAVSATEQQGAESVPAAQAAIDRARETIALTPKRRVDEHVHELAALLDVAEDTLTDQEPGRSRRDDFARLEAELRKVRSDLRTPRAKSPGSPPVTKPAPDHLRAAKDKALWFSASRVGLASLIAGTFAVAVGLDHPLWATLGAIATLQGVNYGHAVQRAIQRLLGNAAGALLAAALISADLRYWPIVAVIVVCQMGAELTVTRNYAVASTFVTAMALLLTTIGHPGGTDIAAARVGDTLVGVVVGVILAALTIRPDDRHHLPSAA
ncbi:FUSC family protein [Gordonia westfalica]|uniref:Fusaric acid resistance protein-like n=1 Tax=Gordonia westfalica TaxID=158898 RepID=A0A1H2LHV6_9ACTN|nr:FUSC family protein [Gordonia westfalica]SDU80325.1 Fusaric acid resistance protein-like [Gordonia westfalica]